MPYSPSDGQYQQVPSPTLCAITCLMKKRLRQQTLGVSECPAGYAAVLHAVHGHQTYGSQNAHVARDQASAAALCAEPVHLVAGNFVIDTFNFDRGFKSLTP